MSGRNAKDCGGDWTLDIYKQKKRGFFRPRFFEELTPWFCFITKISNTTARILRSKGKTYSEIRCHLNLPIPKSTLSYWCKNIDLPKWYKEKIDALNFKHLTKAQKMACISNKAKQEKILQDLRDKNAHLSEKLNDKDILKMLLAMLYLGEGGKWKSHRGLYLGSADPNIIRLYMRLLYLCYGIGPENFKGRVCYRADQNLESLQKYWSRVTFIPIKNFYKSKPDSRTIGKTTKKKGYKGVCSLTCGGTHIQLELEAIPHLILGGVAQMARARSWHD